METSAFPGAPPDKPAGAAVRAACALLLLVLLAYWPAMRGGFLWDDDVYVQHNPTLTSLTGLWRIWFEPGATPQYYPLVFTAFWFEWRLWGADPTGYHVVNCFLHALNAILLWRLFNRLGVPGPWFAAAVFALHPVHVESVAWISERKNVLSAAFYLAATWTYAQLAKTARRPEGPKGTSENICLYLATWLLFLGALLSKSVTCTWPAAMGVVLWWRRGRIAGVDMVRLAPMLLVGAASGLWTAWVEKRYVGAEGAAWSMTVAEHVVLAGRILVFYVAKLLWPHPLIPIYPRWTIDAGAWQQWLYPIGCVIILGCLFVWRKRLGRGPLAAAIFFIGTLFPALGLFNVYFMRFSFVADHFQYLASIGVIAAVAAWLSNVQRRLLRVVQAAVLVLLGVNTWAQATTYVSAQTVWSDTLAKNPRAWLAHNNLGVLLEREGQIDEAETHFRAALALEHDLAKVHGNLGSLLADRGDLDAGLHHFQEAIRLAPDSFDARFNFATALLRHGQWRRAADEYRRAIRVRRGDPEAHVGLARALLELGDREGAIHQLRECLRLQPDHDAARILSELDDP